MKKERFIIGIGLIISSILFTFIGVVMLIVFDKSKNDYPKTEVTMALSAIIAWMTIWFGAFFGGVLMLSRGNEPFVALASAVNAQNEKNNNNIANSEAK